jgi:signal transduction histidine kinase
LKLKFGTKNKSAATVIPRSRNRGQEWQRDRAGQLKFSRDENGFHVNLSDKKTVRHCVRFENQPLKSMRKKFPIGRRRVLNFFWAVVFLSGLIFLPLAGFNLIAAPASSETGTNKPPSSEYLDSVHQRGSSDFSDMGSWIWETNTYDRQTVRFWKSFQIPAGENIKRARLRITADNEYTLYLDGREIGRDAEWRHLYEYDITSLLTPGTHVLALEVYNSFNEAGMVLGLRVGLEDGSFVEVKSDSSWLLVPEGINGWEKKTEPGDGWRQAKVLVPFGSEPWGKLDTIDLVPPLQPVIIPFWQKGWFQISLLIVCVVASLVSFWSVTQLMMHKKEKKLLLRERGRIARDIHDDLGLRVTQLVLQGEVAQSESPVGSEARAHFDKMCEEAREALRAMDEVLWAINPRRDTLREFTTYVCGYAQTFLKNTSIQCVLDVEPEMSSETFELPLRRNLLLAVKEALNNAVKYSHATELLLKIRWQNKRLVLTVEDNGRGFDPTLASAERNGLTNMAQRMSEVGGEFHLTSQPGKGCRLEFSTPLIHPQPRFSKLRWRSFARPEPPKRIVPGKTAVHSADNHSN